MKRWILLLALGAAACAAAFHVTPGLVLYAQSLPATKHVAWTQTDVSTDNVTNFIVTVDGTAQNVAPSACTGTSCVAPIALAAFGSHTVTIVAQNVSVSSDPTSLQSSPVTSITFVLNPAPAAASGVKATN